MANNAALVVTEITSEIQSAKRKRCDFTFSVANKKRFIGELGVQRVVNVVCDAIRQTDTAIIEDLNTPSLYEPLIKRVRNESTKLEKPGCLWSYKVGTQDVQAPAGSILLATSTSGLRLGTALSGVERYQQRTVAGKPTPSELWRNDVVLRKAITYLCTNAKKLNDEALSRSRLRVFCMQGHGCHYPTSFPISIVMYVLKREAARRADGKLHCFVDPCAGWGDRLAGALLVGKNVCQSYVGIDPWDVSQRVCAKVYALLHDDAETCSATLLQVGAQSRAAPWPDADLVFTSPPYGALECYNIDSNDASDQQAWRLGNRFVSEFIRPLMQNAATCTRRMRGRVIINIGNAKGAASLTSSIVEEALAAGLVHVETFGMALSVRAPKTTFAHGAPVFRGEPFFVFEHTPQST